MKTLFNDKNGKISSKRLIGIIGSVISLSMFCAMFFTEAKQVSDSLILGVLGICSGLLATTLGERSQKTGGELPEDDDEKYN